MSTPAQISPAGPPLRHSRRRIWLRRGLMSLGALSLLLIGFIISLQIYLVTAGSRLDAESKAFADEAVRAITKNWDPEEALRRASPAFLQGSSRENVIALFGDLKRLGPPEAFLCIQGEAQTRLFLFSRNIIVAHYVSILKFKTNRVHFVVDAIKGDHGWQLLGFHINYNAPLPTQQ